MGSRHVADLDQRRFSRGSTSFRHLGLNIFHINTSSLTHLVRATMPLPRIAVIGAGAAGLAQAKQVLDAFRIPQGPGVELVVFEARRDVGGVW